MFDAFFLVFVEGGIAGGFAFFEDGDDLLEGFEFGDGVFVGFGVFADSLDALFDLSEVGKDEFKINDVDISEGIDGFVDVGDIGVMKASDDVDDGIDFADVGKELVAESFAFGGPFDESGNVDEFDTSGENLFGARDLGEDFESWVGDADDSDVWFDGAEGEVGGLGLCVSDHGVEEG